MGVTGIESETKTTDKEVILILKIPGLSGESVNINDDRIRIAYDAKKRCRPGRTPKAAKCSRANR